jgi:hypothetical protein
MGVLCFLEHWLKEYITLISIKKFKLVSNFSRKTSDRDGSFICMSNIYTLKK